MDDHDQRLKSLLEEFLPEFMALFFPQRDGRFVFSQLERLKQDAFLDPPEGERRQLDLVAKLPTTVSTGDHSEDCLIVIHIEVDSATSATRLRNRMFQYYAYLERSHGLPVLPIGLYIYVGRDGISKDVVEKTLWGHTLLRFEYFSIGLAALDGVEYHSGSNVLGIALSALMKLPAADRALFLAEGLERIENSGENELRRYLLGNCFRHYLPISEDELEEARRLMAERFTKGRSLMNGLELLELRGEQRGIQLGRQKALREVAIKLITKRFGPLSEVVLGQLNELSAERIDEIVAAVLDATSLGELGLSDS